MNKESIIKNLELVPHPEGGYFREVFRSGATPMQSKGQTDKSGDVIDFPGQGRRNFLTSIYWMLTPDSEIGWWCRNQSDHVHYHHGGATITYQVIDEQGNYSIHRLGQDLENGDVHQLVVRGGCWKACSMEKGEFALIGEAVAPGFDFNDFEFGTTNYFQKNFPKIFEQCLPYIKDAQNKDFDSYYT